MSEKVELNKEDVEKAYQEGCPDVKKVLRTLFPWVERTKEWGPVSGERISIEKRKNTNDSNEFFIHIKVDGKFVASLISEGRFLINEINRYRIISQAGTYWKIEERN